VIEDGAIVAYGVRGSAMRRALAILLATCLLAAGPWILTAVGESARDARPSAPLELARTWPDLPDGVFFSQPSDVAVAPDGTLYVCDTYNNRVVRLSAEDTLLGTIGLYGTGRGQFNNPRSVAVGVDGALYVADVAENGYRIQKFSSTGTFLLTWRLPAGISSIDLAADSGTVYVVHGATGEVRKYSLDGTYVGLLEDKSLSVTYRPINGPLEIAASSGSVWVRCSTGGGDISKWTSAGRFLYSFSDTYQTVDPSRPASSTAGLPLTMDHRIAVDRTGRLCLVDPSGNVYMPYEGVPPGAKSTRYLVRRGPMRLSLMRAGIPAERFSSVALSPDGSLYAVPKEYDAVIRSPKGFLSVYTLGAAGTSSGRFWRPRDTAVGPDGSLLVLDTGNNRVQRFDAQGLFKGSFGTSSTVAGAVRVTCDTSGSAYVLAQSKGKDDQRYICFDSGGRFVSQTRIDLNRATVSCIAVGPDGAVYIGGDFLKPGSSAYIGFIARYENGILVRRLEDPRIGSYAPADMAIGPDGALYYASVIPYFGLGSLFRVDGKTGLALPGSLSLDSHSIRSTFSLDIAQDGAVFILGSDIRTGAENLYKFSPFGSVGGSSLVSTSTDSSTSSVEGLALGKDGAVFVADRARNRVRKYVPWWYTRLEGLSSPASVTVNRTFTVTGSVTPTHAVGAAPVRVQTQLWNSSRRSWSAGRSFNATITSSTGTKSTYTAKISLSGSLYSTVTWRIRAVHGAGDLDGTTRYTDWRTVEASPAFVRKLPVIIKPPIVVIRR
jgi:tripartite motif-containing protein 71